MADQVQEAMLQKDSKNWNSWRSKNPQVAIDLSFADLRDLELVDIDLSNANLHNADLSNTHLFKCNISHSDLTEAILEKTRITASTFANSLFIRAKLTDVYSISGQYENTDFSDSIILRSTLAHSGFFKANFTNAIIQAAINASDLQEVNFTNADVSGVNFTESNLKRANLINTKFYNNIFYRTDLSGLSFKIIHKESSMASNSSLSYKYAKLIETDLEGWHMGLSDFDSADFSRAKLKGINLKGRWLHSATLIEADLTEANLEGATLNSALMGNCILVDANLVDADLTKADLQGANLTEANLEGANLKSANLANSLLTKANLTEANLIRANLENANLTEATLEYAAFTRANLTGAILKGCSVYGVSTWSIQGKPANEEGLVITHAEEARITVSDIQVAQFIYLLINRDNLRNVIYALTTKAVLILGRFTSERKLILDSIADELKRKDFLPIIFDFEGPISRDVTETIKILAGLSYFVIVDITNPKSSPLELQATVPDYQIPFIPIVENGEKPFSMFADLAKYPWMSQLIGYSSYEDIINYFPYIINAASAKYDEIKARKSQSLTVIDIKDMK